MIIFIDGFQNTGKSTLINNCKYKHSRFPFNQYLDELPMNLNTYQFGKDFGICFAAQFIKDNVVLDRGPLSTVFYSLKENRFGENTLDMVFKFLQLIKQNKGYKFVWLKKINDNGIERKHDDGFDYLDDDNDEKKEEIFTQMMNLCAYVGIKVHVFTVDFSKKEKQNFHLFNDFLEGLFNEHNRN